jgi:hypothetical protein
MPNKRKEHLPNVNQTRYETSNDEWPQQQEDHTTLMSKIIYGEKLYMNEREDVHQKGKEKS